MTANWLTWATAAAAVLAVVGVGGTSKESRLAGTSVLCAAAVLWQAALLHGLLRGEMSDPSEAAPLVVRWLGESLEPVVSLGAFAVLFLVLTTRASGHWRGATAVDGSRLERRLAEFSAVAAWTGALGLAVFFRDALFATAVLDEWSCRSLPWGITNAALGCSVLAVPAGLASLALGRRRRASR